MKIEDLRSEKKENWARMTATVMWEDCDRPTHEVYFETVEPFVDGLKCKPHAFLVGCIVPALHYGEERIFIDAEICPPVARGPDDDHEPVSSLVLSTRPSPGPHRNQDKVPSTLQGVVREAGLPLVPVYTNLYLNYCEEDARDYSTRVHRERPTF